MKYSTLIGLLLIYACSGNRAEKIEIPMNVEVEGLELLAHIRDATKEEPKNTRLLSQELYYCEQFGWPQPCGEALEKAEVLLGSSEKLTDQKIAYHFKQGNRFELQQLLNQSMETRSRLETKIQLRNQIEGYPENLIKRYRDRYDDLNAQLFILDRAEETTHSSLFDEFENLRILDSSHERLLDYYPLLFKNGDYEKCTQVIADLASEFSNPNLNLTRAHALNNLNYTDSAIYSLQPAKSDTSRRLIADWFKSQNNWDSALVYYDHLLEKNQDDKTLLLNKAEALESRGSVTRSLPFYERVLQKDTTDTEMAQRVAIVRRKVAYLRRLREQKKLPPILNLERKTNTQNN